jgi:hypothetical protein
MMFVSPHWHAKFSNSNKWCSLPLFVGRTGRDIQRQLCFANVARGYQDVSLDDDEEVGVHPPFVTLAYHLQTIIDLSVWSAKNIVQDDDNEQQHIRTSDN